MFNQKYLYLLINLLTIAVPFAASFYRKAPFYKKWKSVGVAILFPAVFFLIWDQFYTSIGVWGFNPDYVTGLYIGRLPLEEVLFFVCIPYACLFTYFALSNLFERDYFFNYQDLISSALVFLLLVLGTFYIEKAYTGMTFILCGIFISYHLLKLRSRFLGRFYFSFIFLLIPFLIVNGVLTGSFIPDEVVWYNNEENLGARIGTIPVEDVFYGMLLLMMNISIFEWREEAQNQQAVKRKKVTSHVLR